MFVHKQVQARHVNAATLCANKADEGANPRSGTLHVAIAGIEANRQGDVVHAYPVQYSIWTRWCLGHGIGQWMDGAVSTFHRNARLVAMWRSTAWLGDRL
jgi:hypothetical protein